MREILESSKQSHGHEGVAIDADNVDSSCAP